MKKLILMIATAFAAAMPMMAATETVNGIEWKYTVSGGKASLDSYCIDQSTTGAITIPSTLGGYSVTGIGDYAFFGCDEVTSITIPSRVTSIGDYAFGQCDGLTSVTIPASVTSIGDYAFWWCYGLTGITIPSGVTSIGDYAFCGCGGLTSITIPSSVASIGEGAFSSCDGLADASGFVIVRNVLYSYCGTGGAVTIPSGVTSIGDYAFDGCDEVTSITIPSSVTSIGECAFTPCLGLKSFVVASGNPNYKIASGLLLAKDGKTLVAAPGGLTGSVTIPSSVTSIGDFAFGWCYDLTGITIPSSVTSIGKDAFRQCYGLTSITIPSSVTSIGGYAFYGCVGLKSFVVVSGNTSYKNVSGLLLTKDGKTLVAAPAGLTSITVPDSVTSIGKGAFAGCVLLTSITIPDSVTSIGVAAFEDCMGLTSVTIPPGVTSISDFAFSGCQKLAGITIPPNVTNIGDYAFQCCLGLESITIPDSVTSIGDFAFLYCDSLTSVTIPRRFEGRIDDIFFDDPELGDIPEDRQITYYDPSYAVVFNANGGTGGKTFTIFEGRSLGEYMSKVSPVWDGYTFDGWWTARVGGTKVTASTVVTGNATYYAHWVSKACSITFHASGGTGGKKFASAARGRALSYYMDMVSPKYEANGYAYEFDGWWTERNGGDPVSATDVVSGEATYYAHWKIPTCSITFHASGGTGGKKFASVALGRTLGYYMNQVSPKYEANGYSYTFDGWWTARDGGERVTAETVVTGGKTYYAHWIIPTCTVTFHANGGTGGKKFASVALGRTLGYYMDQVKPVNGSKTFNGWYTAKTGGSKVSAETVVTGDVTYYARWK